MPTSRPTRTGSAIDELRPGLYRWTAPPPDREPDAEPEGAADWPQLVGSVLDDAGETVVLIDPPAAAREPLDGLVAGQPVSVVTTVRRRGRSRAEVLARYRAAPAGIELVEIPRAGETMVWIPEHRALVPGDRIIGAENGAIRVCAPSWLGCLDGAITHDELREELRALPDLPVELVLVSHCEPVPDAGRAALESALVFSSR